MFALSYSWPLQRNDPERGVKESLQKVQCVPGERDLAEYCGTSGHGAGGVVSVPGWTRDKSFRH